MRSVSPSGHQIQRFMNQAHIRSSIIFAFALLWIVPIVGQDLQVSGKIISSDEGEPPDLVLTGKIVMGGVLITHKKTDEVAEAV